MRKEQEIFDDLAKLCTTSGYVHAIAHFSFRDNIVSYVGEMKPEDMQHLFSDTRLIRTELSTLKGLLIKQEIDYALPSPAVMQEYLAKTEALLGELHHAMSEPMWAGLDPKKVSAEGFNPFTSGTVLREPIFYGGESAYSFQYRDLAAPKYASDDEWLKTHKGFSIGIARDVVHAVARVQGDKLTATRNALKEALADVETVFPAFLFTTDEVARESGINRDAVQRVLTAFALPAGERNEGFNELHDFNVANALPLLPVDDGEFVLFHIYSLVEALYEAPFYWMCADTAYVTTAMRHRGRFTEDFSRERLDQVFGKDKVYSNLDIFEAKGRKVGEIDVLVIFGNRAIVLQAKSKRLTLEARRGNNAQIRDDFKKSIQDSYDQGYACATMLLDPKYRLINSASEQISIPHVLTEVYIICVVADHYPALAFQARQFLRSATTDVIQPPFIMDVFALDAITEMLQSPLRLLNYVSQRTKYVDKLLAHHEMTILSYHLKKNLWLDDEFDQVMLHDDISIDLNIAMAVRRDGVAGERTPAGILTRFSSTSLGRIVEQIEERPDPATIDLGLMLLTLGENTVVEVSKGIDAIADQARKDRKSHDFTVGIGSGGTGLTIHCNDDPVAVSGPRLQGHCHKRKYTQKADTWFGLCILPDQRLRFGLNLNYKWEQSAEMDALTNGMKGARKIPELLPPAPAKRKVGRNDPCPCGSGLKYKKCCLKH
jgi:hypothetical protein